jgi:hypothetical protein
MQLAATAQARLTAAMTAAAALLRRTAARRRLKLLQIRQRQQQ